MTFLTRHPMVEAQFCTFNPDSTENLPVAAGTLLRVVGTTDNGRAIVDVVSDISGQTVVGWLMQRVKAHSTENPTGFLYAGDFGSSDCFLGDPCGVAMGPGAVYEVDTYVDEGSNGIAAGTLLYCDDDGKLSDTNADSSAVPHAMALVGLSSTQTAAGAMLLVKALI